MLKPSEPTSSTLQLVASDMTEIMETLDTRELDLEDGEYDTADGNAPGACRCCRRGVRPPSPRVWFSHTFAFLCSGAFALHGDLPHGGFQGAHGQSLPVLSDHRQDPGGGAVHLSSGPLQHHHTEERQQGAHGHTCPQDISIHTVKDYFIID